MQTKKIIQKKFHVKKGDTVKVIAGDDRSKSGKILSIISAENKALVEGINIVTKHIKPTASKPNGGIEKREAPVHISNLMLVDSGSGTTAKTAKKTAEKSKVEKTSKK
ncbi:MAG: 50S ribosomal protein L24 [Cytophagaceae bacterium]